MLISENVKKLIEKEIKSQNALYKLLENQEKQYKSDLSKEKEEIKKSIDYYNNILNENN